ncbi:protein OS-9 [Nephila pilipes]|uniref:Protein OS-9 n=1 Tax=Nephila pilipes TaxID=299642 RepID=A0A8X6TEN1_NEPPI|nr:protein OS-9 [Nephila pilipes]
MFGEDTMGVTQIKEWFNRFKDGRTSAESEQRCGRPQTARIAANVERQHSFFGTLIFFHILNCICSLNVEELKPLNYEVDILQTPIKKGEEPPVPLVHMTSMYGQEYSCTLPQVEEEEVTEKITADEKSTDVKELLKPLRQGSCLLKGKDWWTYEFCFGHYIKQFHIEDGQIIGQVITLGLYDSDYDWNNDTDQEKFKHVKQRYHSQLYVNGTKCDLTGQPRNAEVRLYCEEDAGDYIYRVDEPGTCSYIITIHTSRLCSHPQLKPLPSKKAYSIPCYPLLNEEQYSSYLQKLNEEKEIADQKRSQWLNNQQERLQVMKNENLNQAETDTSKEPESDDDEKPKVKNEKPKFNDDLITGIEEDVIPEIEKLKSFLPPEKFATVKSSIQKHFDAILNEAEDNNNPELTDEDKDLSFQKLTSTLNMLLKKLDKAEKDVVEATKELNKVKSVMTETPEETDGKKTSTDEASDKQESLVEEVTSKVLNDEKQSKSFDDNEVQVRIRRLDRRAPDEDGKLYEMDSAQRRKLEQAVKEKLEKAGLDTGGRKIEVKIITAGYYDNEDGKDFHTLSDEETNQFQNMIMALLTGQQEAVHEMERQKKLEENYKFTWDSKEEKDD